MRAAIYLRVSTTHQTVENQRKQLETLANSREWQIVKVYRDEGLSGDSKERPAFNEMMSAAKSGEFDCILIFQLSRLGRSLNQIVQTISELNEAKVGVYSMSEHISTMDDNPYAKVTLAIFAALAEVELGLIRERVRAGVERAKANGVIFGRKHCALDIRRVLELKKEGLGLRKIAKQMGVSHTTIARRLDDIQNVTQVSL